MGPILLIGASGQLGSDLREGSARRVARPARRGPTSTSPIPPRSSGILDAHAPARGWSTPRRSTGSTTSSATRGDPPGIRRERRGRPPPGARLHAPPARGCSTSAPTTSSAAARTGAPGAVRGGRGARAAERVRAVQAGRASASSTAAPPDRPGRGHIIVRSSGLYGVAGSAGKGGNFVETMLRLAARGQAHPRRGRSGHRRRRTRRTSPRRSPGSSPRTRRAASTTSRTAGACSWFEFARQIFALCRLTPEPHADLERGVQRPGPAPAAERRPREHARRRARGCRRSARGPRRWTPTSAPRDTSPADPRGRRARSGPLLQ